ncbi:MAG: CidA/LrgA family protein [Candidatus Velthaea sp.]
MATASRSLRRPALAAQPLSIAGIAAVRIAAQIGLLWAISAGSSLAVSALHLPLPGNVLGMIVLFGALASGSVKLDWFERGGTLLTKHLAFFFVPITVGLMGFGGTFVQYGLAIVATLSVSAVAGLLASGLVTQALARRIEPVTPC